VKHLTAVCAATCRSTKSQRHLALMEKRDGSVQHFISEKPAHRRLRLRERCSRFQPADNRQPPVAHVARTVSPEHWIGGALPVGERQPNIVIAPRSNSGESLLGDANNREGNVIQFNRAPYHVARAAKGALPVAIVQHGNRCGRRFIVRCLQQPARGGFKAHRAEELPRNELAIDTVAAPFPVKFNGPELENAVVAEKILACAISRNSGSENEQP